MANRDYFIMRLREDAELRRSFKAVLEDSRQTLMREMVLHKEELDIRHKQGAIQHLGRLETVLEKEISVPLASDDNKR